MPLKHTLANLLHRCKEQQCDLYYSFMSQLNLYDEDVASASISSTWYRMCHDQPKLQVMKYRVLCCPLIASDVIVNDHDLPPSRVVQVLKGINAWLQATINNQRSFPMPDIWVRVSALDEVDTCLRIRDWEPLCTGRNPRLISIHSDTLTVSGNYDGSISYSSDIIH